ncbi:ATP-binding protein [Labilibacter sediminis]|nr:ATP-binding protein [Labilibacter sediminis]
MKIIDSIRIKYFRSILNTTRGNQTHLSTSDINIIVGSNDAGKSNYLRALSLFFNNHSEPGMPFSFWKDYSNQRHGIRREENRIEIELIINPPLKQAFKNNGKVRWSKIWKEGSTIPAEKIEYLDGSEFTSNKRSSYYKWLKKLKFRYIPAIKSEQYFSDLMYDLYDVLQEDTNELEKEFNQQVGEKTLLISQQLNSRLNIESVLQYKGSFRDLFNSLEFGSKDGKQMLSQRGDGIKVRHIPIILQNIAEAELRENRHREPIANTIWGFEEPENNLEYDSARKLAESFIEYANKIHFGNAEYSKYDEGIQLFITTHSPIFYTISNVDSDKINSFFVKKQNDDSSSIKHIANENSIRIETEMKLLPLFELSKHWQQINNQIQILEQEKREIENQLDTFSNTHKCIFLTEDKKKGLVDKFLSANRFKMAEVDLRSYKGCTNLGSAEVLYKYLKDKYEDNCPIIIVHRDKDYLTEKEIREEKDKFERIGMHLFITEGTDIESYFVRPNHVIKCHNEIDSKKLNELIKQAKEENRDKAISLLRIKEYGEKHKDKRSHLSDFIPQFYSANEDRLFHGKAVYRRLKGLIQEEFRYNAQIDTATEELIDNELQIIHQKIWN